MEREVVPGELERGQTMQSLIQTLSRFLVFIPRAMGRTEGFLCREVMSSDEGQVGNGVTTADFAGRNVVPSGLELLSFPSKA